MIRLPAPTKPEYAYTAELDGLEYTINLGYNGRTHNWYMDLAKVDGTVIANGAKVVCDFPLFDREAHLEPPGLFIAMSTSATDNSPPEYDELLEGARVRIVYFTKAEISGEAYTQQNLIDTYGGTGVFPL